MPKEHQDIFDKRGKFQMQEWGLPDTTKKQIHIVLDDGHFYINIDKDKPCSSIKQQIAKLYEIRKEIAASYKEHYK